MTQSFSELQLSPTISRAIAEMGYESMTPIQAQAIPVVLQGRDVMGAAQTRHRQDPLPFAAAAATHAQARERVHLSPTAHREAETAKAHRG